MTDQQLNNTVTFVIHPPTRDRQEWIAHYKDYDTGKPVGIGDTEQAAMRNLLDWKDNG